MAGIYIHIPFCRKACRYCDFYFTVSLKFIDQYLKALLSELSIRNTEIKNYPIRTVYFGGGTPSVLSEENLQLILECIFKNYNVVDAAEITIETNPDDLKSEYLKSLKRIGFNRLSVGIQSFKESDLSLMNRSHSLEQAEKCVPEAKENGFENISIDLIYGIPGLTLSDWEKNLQKTLQLPIHHISAYHLTYEPGTIFHHWKKRGKIKAIHEKDSISQYEMLRKMTNLNEFEHYEISNFAREGYRSRHNTTYWNGKSYFGFGPSAHSFNGGQRRWNNSSLKNYIDLVEKRSVYFSSETLSLKDQYHDYLITSLRTREGAELEYVKKTFGKAAFDDLMRKTIPYIKEKDLGIVNSTLQMTPEGWLKSDMIISDLMLAEKFILPEPPPSQ